MEQIEIYYIHSMMFHGRAWQQAASQLADLGIKLTFINQRDSLELLTKNHPDILVAELGLGEPHCNEIIAAVGDVPHRLGLSDTTPADFTTFDRSTSVDFSDYTEKISAYNYAGAMLLLAAKAGYYTRVREKKEVQLSGIYHPDSDENFSNVDQYLQWREAQGKPAKRKVALIFYYGQLIEGSLDELDWLIHQLENEQNSFCPVPIFSVGIEQDAELPDWYSFLKDIRGLGAIISCIAGRLLKHQDDTSLLEEFNVPIIQSLRSHSQTQTQWQEDPRGLPPMSAVFSQTYPEMFGAIRPIMTACLREEDPGKQKNNWIRSYSPVKERIETLCARLGRHFTLREKPNGDKKLTIVLHNNPCKGVEATIGMAVGLDTFKSLGLFLQALSAAGYDTGNCPEDGHEILTEILEKKAIAEFRWTTIDEIVRKGGALYMMGRSEYNHWFNKQDEIVRQKILKDWDEFPGEGVAWQQDGRDVLVITGICYGNVRIMNQPKRGCYGAKCTGEVCRILHNPNLAPPHQWFATYKYIQDNSDAVIHFGTEGALEYLPGKQNGLSGSCFPEISLGDLPNFYLYVMDVIGEGMAAKRRGQATLVDHMGPIFSPVKLDKELLEIEGLLAEYHQAEAACENKRMVVLKDQLQPKLAGLDLGNEEENPGFTSEIDLTGRRIAAIKRSLAPEGMHILGQSPESPERGRLLATMLRKPSPGLPGTAEIGSMIVGEGDDHSKTAQLAGEITVDSRCDGITTPGLKNFALELEDRLGFCHREIDAVLHGLNGGYITPGPAGSLSGGRLDPLPTGRNFYAKDVALLPTRAALQVGEEMAEGMLGKYLAEEGCFPARIGLSIWSSDAFKSDGELFCQILSIMGVRPVWDKQDKVEGLEVISLEELVLWHEGKSLDRPRVDVTIETSGIMRDMVPRFCELLDEAVVIVSALDESHERNFIKKHSDEMLAELRAATDSKLSDKEMQRLATFRVFSSAPGTYGTGVGLALDASAWTTDKELAEIYINRVGHGYESKGKSTQARDILARQLAGLDIAYMKQTSEEYDILDAGCYAVSLGSLATAARALGGKEVKMYWTEAGYDKELCDIREQLQRSTAGRLLNSNWIKDMKEHGYQGAMAVSSRVNNLFKWSATSHKVSKDLFDRVVSTYILNDENRRWLMDENPYAMEEITRRLLEAASRELWQADADMLKAVQDAALEIEGDMEETIGEVSEEFQGSKVEVLGTADVDKWKHEWRIAK